MMARSTKRSNQRPDTLMQDRISPNSNKSSCNARPDHTFGSLSLDRRAPDALGLSASLRKRTGANPLDMSALCQKQTFALQHVFLFDHLVGRGQQTRRHFKSERPDRPAGAKGEALVGGGSVAARFWRIERQAR